MSIIMATNNDGPRSYHYNPLLRQKTPPIDVWVNLAAAYPLQRNAKPFIPHGLDLTDTVAARLHLWAVTTTGHWIGWATYEDRE